MNKNKALAKNTLIISIGKVCTQCISFLLLPLYSDFLATDEYGTVDLITTYVQLLIPVVVLQIDQALFRFLIPERNNNKVKTRYISTALAFFVVQALFISIICGVVVCVLSNKYIVYLYITLMTTSLLNIGLQIARGFGDNITYSVASFISALVSIIFNIVFIVFFHMKAEGMLLAGIIGNIVAYIYINKRKFIFLFQN